MHPDIIIPLLNDTLVISSYRLFFILACAAVLIISAILLRRHGLPVSKTVILLVIITLAVPVGARLLHAITNPGLYLSDPEQLWSLQLTGFSLMGGLLLATAAGIAAARWLGLDPWQMADRIAPGLGAGLALMRVGCYLNGCCFGIKTDLPWAVHYPIGSIPYKYYLPALLEQDTVLPFALINSPGIHPAQLYELLAALLITAAAVFLLRRKAPAGVPFLVFALLFAGFRWFNSTLRVPAVTLSIDPWFYPVLYLVIILLCLLLIIKKTGTKARQDLQ